MLIFMTFELRDRLLSMIVDKSGGPLALQRKSIRIRAQAPQLSISELIEALVKDGDPGKGKEVAETLANQHIQFVTLLDADYPIFLKEIPDPPLVLFYSGSLSVLKRPCISIVGSRKVSDYGQQVTRQLAGELAHVGFTVVSGLALGVDAFAHQAALEVQGRTAGVLGSGIDHIYPREHRSLAKSMVRNQGLVISEFPPGAPPRPFHFPFRNRIISGLAHATIVVEAGEKSGTLITARHCLDQGRELFAVPGPIHAEGSKGANLLIAKGEAQLITSVESLVSQLKPLLGMAVQHESRVMQTIEDPISRKIYEKLDAFEPLPLDLLVAELELDPGNVISHLVELQSLNLIESKPGQLYLRNSLARVAGSQA